MKATGVVRRIDDLGRIVLPKELRRTMRIKEGESLEIFTDGENQIILKKYSPVSNLNDFAIELSESIYTANKVNVIITDNERIIASAGDFNVSFIGKEISEELRNCLNKRSTEIVHDVDNFEISTGLFLNNSFVIKPINVFGDIMGALIIEGPGNISDVEKNLAEFGGVFLSRYLEV